MSHFCRYKNVNQRKKYPQNITNLFVLFYFSSSFNFCSSKCLFSKRSHSHKNLNDSSSDSWAIRRLSLGKSSVFEQVWLFGMKSGIFTNVWNTPPKTLFGIFYTISKSGQYQCIHTSLSSSKQEDDTRLYH